MDDEIGTLHSDFRLMQRAREFDKSLTELWDEGVECEVKYHGYDEARVVPSHGVVLLMEDGRIITVLDRLHNVTVDGQNLEQFLDSALEE